MNQLFANLPLLMAAPGADPAAGGASIVPTLITFGLVFVIFYFLIIRPQNKKQKETKEMLKSLKKGDKVVSIGGIHGTVQSIKENEVVIKVDTNSKMTLSRSAISSVVESSKPSKKVEEPVEESDAADEETEADDE
jgi:preprotein translocase subunit YajC